MTQPRNWAPYDNDPKIWTDGNNINRLVHILYGYTCLSEDETAAKARSMRAAAQLHERLQAWGRNPKREII